MLPPEVINEFQKKFANEKEISKPEEANGLEKITVFRGDEKLDVSDVNDSRTPQFKLRTPKLSKTTTVDMKENPLYKAAQLAKKSSPDILTAAAPPPPPELSPPLSREESIVIEEESNTSS
jgi:hypothetical protein